MKVTAQTLADCLAEIHEQPPWRNQADREMDYCDGNQSDSETLQAMRDKGMKPTTENVLGPTMEDIAGIEAKNRTDWKVIPDGDSDEESEAVAKAIGYKLYQAEKRSGADKALTQAYESLAKVGVGFVEVDRSTDPFAFPYQTNFLHRNECWWDWFSKKPDFSDARWFLRRRWVHVDTAKLLWPNKKAIVDGSRSGWGNIDDLSLMAADSGQSLDLAQSWEIERGWSVEEQEWKDPSNTRVCLFHLLTRHYVNTLVLKLSNGRVVEFDEDDPLHIAAVTSGIRLEKAMVSRIKKTIFLGPHTMQDEVSEFDRFNIVGIFGKIEDRTRVPFGTLRWLMPLQDEINARITKMKWLLSSTRTVRTDGAVKMTDEVLRHEVGRPDADIKLDQAHMAKQGAMFEIDTNMELNKQQYDRLLDLRESVKRISGVSAALSGDAAPENNGAMTQAIEQSVQSLATLNDNFAYGRTQVGDLLMSMIVRDLGKELHEVTIKGNALKEDEIIVLNAPSKDPETGMEILTNDVQRTMMKVDLEDVPSTPSFRQQEMMSLTEVMKSASDDIKAILMPHYLHLTNIPDKDEIVQAVREVTTNANIPAQQVEELVGQARKEAYEEARIKLHADQKDRELDLKEQETLAKIDKMVSETVKNNIEGIFSGVQTAVQVAINKAVAGSADQILNSAGYEDKDSAPIVAPIDGPIVAPPVRENTSPNFPPRVQEPDLTEIEEPVGQEMVEPDTGINQGIEAGV